MRLVAALLLAGLLFGSVRARAQDVGAGLDFFVLLPGSQQLFEGPYAFPANFFGPGSDPFTSAVAMIGVPIQTFPGCPDPLGNTCVVLRRNQDAHLTCCPGSDVVETELVALSLMSASPITVTFNGGQNPELWDVRVRLSDTQPALKGSATLRVNFGGNSVDVSTPYSIVAECRKTTLPSSTAVVDWGQAGIIDSFDVADAVWSYSGPPGLLDTSCDSNFRIGIKDDTQVVGFSAERSNRYSYFLASSPAAGPTRGRLTSWAGVKAIYR